MATYSTSEFKSGLKVLIDSEPCSMIEVEKVKPGKGTGIRSREAA